jgi:hypothetical protein
MGSSKRYLPRAIHTWDIYNSLEKKYKCYKNTITADYIMGDIMKRMLVVIAIALLIVVSNTAGAVSTNKDVNDSIKLEQNYKLRLVSIDMSGPVRSAVLDLIPGEKKTVLNRKIMWFGDVVTNSVTEPVEFIGQNFDVIGIDF